MAHPADDDLGDLVTAIQALQARRRPLEERRRAIEEKKGLTAPHIYEKVRRETEEKIAAVDAEGASLRSRAHEARARLAADKAVLDAELARANEEVEEIRFRQSLGEFEPEEFRRLEGEKLSVAEEVGSRLARLEQALIDLDEFVAPPGASLGLPPEAPDVSTHPGLARPVPEPPPPAPAPVREPTAARPEVSEMEALFGSAPVAAARPAERAAVKAPPLPGEERTTSHGVPAFGRPPRPAHQPEETTQDLGVRAGEPAPVRARAEFPAASSSSFRPVLIVKTKDKDRGEDTYDLSPGQTLIGRAPENDIILLEESVSRRHARIVVENGACMFEDLGSANGSYVNGERLRPKQPRKLQDNDVIKLGQLLALFRVNPED